MHMLVACLYVQLPSTQLLNTCTCLDICDKNLTELFEGNITGTRQVDHVHHLLNFFLGIILVHVAHTAKGIFQKKGIS